MGGDDPVAGKPAMRATQQGRSLPSLLKQRNQTLAELAVLDAEIREEYHRLVASQYGIKIGSVVLDSRGYEYRVAEIVMPLHADERPLVWGNRMLKRKGASLTKRPLYGNWKLK